MIQLFKHGLNAGGAGRVSQHCGAGLRSMWLSNVAIHHSFICVEAEMTTLLQTTFCVFTMLCFSYGIDMISHSQRRAMGYLCEFT